MELRQHTWPFFWMFSLAACADEAPQLEGHPAKLEVIGAAFTESLDPALPPTFSVLEGRTETEEAAIRGSGIVDLPPAGVRQFASGKAGAESRLEVLNEDGQVTGLKRAFAIAPRSNSPYTVPDIWRVRTHGLQGTARLELTDPTHGAVVDEVGRQLLYVRFLPEVPPDAPERVDWTLAENRRTRRAALMAAEAERQEELLELAARNLAELESATSCTWVRGAKSANAAVVLCNDPTELLSMHAVESVSSINDSQATMRGDDHRSNFGMQHGLLLSAGFDGSVGVGLQPPERLQVEVAVIDPLGFWKPQLHPAYDATSGGPTRITRRRTCTSSTCTDTSTPTTGIGPNPHGSAIMGAFASVMGFQDPNVTDYADRTDRSYGAWGADLELYLPSGGSAAAFATAIEDAVATDSGVDIVTISTVSLGPCARPGLEAAMRDAWDLAYSLGTLGVTSATNWVNRQDDSCTVSAWATRPDLVIVGAVGDEIYDTTGNATWLDPSFPVTPPASWVYDTEYLMGWHWTDLSLGINCPNDPVTRCWSSGVGGATLKVAPNGVQEGNAWKMIDLVAPAHRELSPSWTTADQNGLPTYVGSSGGTSISAPEVASVAASMLHWAYYTNQSLFETAQISHVNLMLMGDGARGTHRQGTAMTSSYSGKDRLWGNGRIKARNFTDAGMDGPWGWGTGWFDVEQGDRVDILIGSGPVNADVDYWRGAMFWDEWNLDALATGEAAVVTFSVVRTDPTNGTCPNPGGTGGTVIRQDTSKDIEKVIVIHADSMTSLHGKCAWMRFSVDYIDDPGWPYRRIYRADYFEDRDREAAENLPGID